MAKLAGLFIFSCMFSLTLGALPVASGQQSGASSASGKRKATQKVDKPAVQRKSNRSATSANQELARQRVLQTEQKQLQARLAQLKKQTASMAASHTEASDALAESEAAISVATRKLRELTQARRQLEKQVTALRERTRHTLSRQDLELQQLSTLLRTQYVMSRKPTLALAISGTPPAQQARDLTGLNNLSVMYWQSINTLQERHHELTELESDSLAKQKELVAVTEAEQDHRRQLLKQQTTRRQTLDRLARQLGEQKQSIVSLEKDDRRLSSLLQELTKVLAEQAQRERSRANQSRSNQEARASASAKASAAAGPSSKAPNSLGLELPASSKFAQRRGTLTLPVKGEVIARFGSPRRTEAGVNAPTWKGVFIKAAEGEEVHAVAPGRVVFADWLRGFGNLLILDHGEEVLSVYGSNESLLVNVGDRVDNGDVIALVGNSGGTTEAGLYFELRFQGRPFDPLSWAAAR